MIKLHNYFRSSASYRVRIALNLKQLPFEHRTVHLTRGGGEQFSAAFRELNEQALVPVLEDGPHRITQSLAIIEYLDEVYPNPPLMPRSPAERARVRSLALSVACEVHPLNNLRALNYLTQELGVSSEAKTRWYQHWVALGLDALESQISRGPKGSFCHGDEPGLADCCLIPQLFNARRFNCDLSRYPTLLAIEENCSALSAFRDAAPERQPDAEL
ncbi:MAG TPA: maleylacetoacetate isomerase [Polyangiaceae bacterium]|nr:maleylacetoacetate isomerase [Polyangiaceae bacterium]